MDISKLSKQELEKLVQDGMNMNAHLQEEIKALREIKPPPPPVLDDMHFLPAKNPEMRLPEIDSDFLIHSEFRPISPMTKELLSKCIFEITQVMKKYKVYYLKVDLIRKF